MSKQDYETPRSFFENLNKKYNFTLDACASPENAKCERYYTEGDPEHDGLSSPWDGNVFVNPPYKRGIDKWICKAIRSAQEGANVVMLLPASTSEGWFHDLVFKYATELWFIDGRLKFEGTSSGARFGNVIVVFNNKKYNIFGNERKTIFGRMSKTGIELEVL